MEVTDADFQSSNDFIDRFEIDIQGIPIGVETPPTQYNGTFGYSLITLSFEVECSFAHYYPGCEPNGCQNFANCTCFPGYTGEECEINIDDCLDAACPENSMCVDGVNSFTCQCLEGFSGENCTLRGVDDCIGVSCGERGQCMDNIDSFKCICDPEHTGDHCETEIGTAGKYFKINPLASHNYAILSQYIN